VTNYVQVSGVGFQVSAKKSARWIAVAHKVEFLSPVLAFSIILLAVQSSAQMPAKKRPVKSK
jgi:hypothetical protein